MSLAFEFQDRYQHDHHSFGPGYDDIFANFATAVTNPHFTNGFSVGGGGVGEGGHISMVVQNRIHLSATYDNAVLAPKNQIHVRNTMDIQSMHFVVRILRFSNFGDEASSISIVNRKSENGQKNNVISDIISLDVARKKNKFDSGSGSGSGSGALVRGLSHSNGMALN
ncbi:hypothetical protein DERP_011152 [Dermatophagoides pteronyssinus]|uniref:Uncharacterized protein n=1 Tax=Dermatophagoides pteronyssinus TaxID=6956 RepID=A0ABQ8J8Z0_DERPT|nr:hypothetical protein DERP_011152 [Dermatophagoides pteronyssinus]